MPFNISIQALNCKNLIKSKNYIQAVMKYITATKNMNVLVAYYLKLLFITLEKYILKWNVGMLPPNKLWIRIKDYIYKKQIRWI